MVEQYGRMATPLAVIGERKFWGFIQNRSEIESLIKEMKR